MKRTLYAVTVFILLGFSSAEAAPPLIAKLRASADAAYQALPFAQDWTNTGLITTSDDWSAVPGILGFRGDGLTAANDVDPQTVLADDSPGVVDVNANQTNPNTFTTGGVAEFHIADPVVALNGSGTADAPYLLIDLNTTGFEAIQVQYNLRDLDGSVDNSIQQVALHYRVGASGSFSNVPGAYVADATTGPSLATLVTPVSVVLPAASDNQAQVQLRIMTTNASGNDEWVGVDDISVSGTPIVGDIAPTVVSTAPAPSATNVSLQANIDIIFSEPVSLLGGWLDVACTTSGSHSTGGLTGGDTTFSFNPDADFAWSESCTITVFASQVSDIDTNDPPDHMAVDYAWSFTTAAPPCLAVDTPIGLIQGSSPAFDPAYGGTQTVQGVVVGDYEGASPTLRGFYVQNLPTNDDDNPATSDGIFVFNGSLDLVSAGQVVQVTGAVSEFREQTQITSTAVETCGTDSVSPVDVTLPFPTVDFPERYEGMLVHLPQTLYVTEHFQLGRFDEVLVSADARLKQPTNIFPPGLDADALQIANNLNQILIDDGTNAQNPDPILFGRGGSPLSASNTLRGGDTATGIVGVLNYTWGGASASPNAYRVRPINALAGSVNFDAANARPAAAPALTGRIRVAGMNLLNFFNTYDGLPDNVDNCTLGVGGAFTDCRGADTAAEFDRQWPKTVAAITGTGADVIGVIEIENDGYGSDSAIQFLMDKLNAATVPGAYAFIDVDLATAQVNALGDDAIKVGLLYKPARVIPVGQTAALNTVEFVNGGDTAPRNRPALAQAFEEVGTGGRFVVAVNHLKSKGSACDTPDAGDGQGNCNIVRTNAANLLTAWLASDPTGAGDPDALILGDLNSYAKEDPIAAIEGAGYTNLIAAYGGVDAYSYVFDGQWGYLDHALSSAPLTGQVTGTADWHINADEPSVLDYNMNFKTANLQNTLYAPDQFRISDHDPVLVDLDPVNYPPELGDIAAPTDPVAVGSAAHVSVPFTDPDWLDTHTAVWDWGDGTTSAGTITEANGAGTAQDSHVYVAPGIYTVTVTLQDNYGNADTAVYQYIVVYDPNGGFVTGGGWIDSPAGAYAPDPSLTGKATFGFVSKYQKGASIPVGNTQFQFHAGDLNFHSASYEWLVVNQGGKNAQFKGTGAINGQGAFKFMLWATDNDPDTFRIKIWSQDAPGEPVVYDNGFNQPLGGGSISVKK